MHRPIAHEKMNLSVIVVFRDNLSFIVFHDNLFLVYSVTIRLVSSVTIRLFRLMFSVTIVWCLP